MNARLHVAVRTRRGTDGARSPKHTYDIVLDVADLQRSRKHFAFLLSETAAVSDWRSVAPACREYNAHLKGTRLERARGRCPVCRHGSTPPKSGRLASALGARGPGGAGMSDRRTASVRGRIRGR